ncbi:MAG: hypothetical protein H6742_11225 [Alphaproteobacteria bacterium]|nr:hypothetical protein [Alphaproteobacteria bacterium]
MPTAPAARGSFPTVLLLVSIAVAACRTDASAPAEAPGMPVSADATGEPASSPGDAAAPPSPFPGQVRAPGLPVAADLTPAELYAGCRERVEQPEADGECSADADCAATGCSGERCVAASVAGDLMSTCEVQPCFQVLDHCGCVEGRCSWSLKDAAPGGGDQAPGPDQEPAQ